MNRRRGRKRRMDDGNIEDITMTNNKTVVCNQLDVGMHKNKRMRRGRDKKRMKKNINFSESIASLCARPRSCNKRLRDEDEDIIYTPNAEKRRKLLTYQHEFDTLPSCLEIHESKIHGRGIFATCAIPEGTKLIRFKGQILTDKECEDLPVDKRDCILYIGNGLNIDVSIEENLSKWINHSCDPNLHSPDESDDFWIITKRNVTEGEELTLFYSDEFFNCFGRSKCNCNSDICKWKDRSRNSEYMEEDSKYQSGKINASAVQKNKKKKLPVYTIDWCKKKT